MHRTQKARGIGILSERYGLRYTLIDPKQINGEIPHVHFPVFARPCPLRPRHGFVDSRVVCNEAELKSLVDEVVSEDPEGEVILMKLINARYSGVITSGMAAIGPDNDGVTSGKNGTIQFPIGPLRGLENLADSAGIEGAPYVEFVNNEIVQLRDGPPVTKGDVTEKWVPRAEKVKRVFSCYDDDEDEDYDLIKWEKLVSKMGEGDVVYLPGQTMLSHYAVHAVCAERPIFFKSPPMIGDEIEPNHSATEITEDHIASLRAGIGLATRTELDPAKHSCAAQLAIFTAHHGPSLIGDIYGCFILGMGATFLVRLGFAASFGEYRHHGFSTRSIGRDYIYEDALFQTWRSQIHLASQAAEAFREHNWRSGYGGSKWADCTEAAITLSRTLIGNVNPKSVLMALNAAIHVAHNNGKWLDKFTNPEAFDLIAAGEVRYTVMALGCIWDFVTQRVSFTPSINKVAQLEAFYERHDAYRYTDCDDEEEEDEEPPYDEDEDSGTDEEGNEVQPASIVHPVVQWNRRGAITHFQMGVKGEYRTFDLHGLPDLDFLGTSYSLAGSMTHYKRTTKGDLRNQAENLKLVDLAKWLDGQDE